jgi:Uma2 family endonuclease
MAGGNLRCPGLGFTLRERLPEGEPVNEFVRFAPDLCIEIIPLSEDRKEMMREVDEYFESGARQVWHLFPETERLRLYTSPAEFTDLGADDDLDGGDLLPGFRRRVADLFDLD